MSMEEHDIREAGSMGSADESPGIGPAEMMRMITGKWVSKPIFIAAELGLADILADGPKPIEAIASETGTDRGSLYRIMRALASLGIFSESEGKVFSMTPAAGYLREGAMRSITRMFNSEWNDKAWQGLSDAVRTGGVAFEAAHGLPLFRWLEDNPKAAGLLGSANEIKASMTFSAIVKDYDFSDISDLVDLGGGTGALLAALLEDNPRMSGVLAELPEVAVSASALLKPWIEAGRCRIVDCDFFRKVPEGYEAYLLSNILHDWDDDRCRKILKNCREAMQADSRLLIAEMIVPPGNEPSIVKLLDLEMMVITGGRERTEDEYRALLEAGGFRLDRIVPCGGNVCLLEAAPV